MNAALKKVNLYDFIHKNKGLDTKLEERGSNLSGGQAQRLALARALLYDTPIYIFDELASNIDASSELLIMDVIKELSKEKTIILISHRMANVVDSDKIYVLDKGRIVESGNHSDLMTLNGKYRNLFTHQSNLEAYGTNKEAIKYA